MRTNIFKTSLFRTALKIALPLFAAPYLLALALGWDVGPVGWVAMLGGLAGIALAAVLDIRRHPEVWYPERRDDPQAR